MTIKPSFEFMIDDLLTSIFDDNQGLGQAAAQEAQAVIAAAIHARGEANVILATGNSQLTFLAAIQELPIDWSRVNVFHMDEYVGLDPHHPASFPLFLRRHLLDAVHPRAFFPVETRGASLDQLCQSYEALLRQYPADLCALGIGENGHLAFNDPPFADFDDPLWVKIVALDEKSRRQQVGEGHFTTLAKVPTHAMTLTIPALLAARRVLAIVPEGRKADAVYHCLTDDISTRCPGSILRCSPNVHLYLDRDSASRLLREKIVS